MLGGANFHKQTWVFNRDPAADDVLHLMKVPADPPGGYEVKSARATTSNAGSASTANYFSVELRNGGTAFTGTVSVAAAIGGTGGWAALTPKEFTIIAAAKNLDAGETLQVVYDETGTGTFAELIVEVEWVQGT